VSRFSLVLPAALIAISFLISMVTKATLGYGFGIRVAVSLAFLIPTGFFMGFAFPSGMIRFGDANKAWYWAINGALGVFASIASLALAMVIGFNNTVLLGALIYVVSALLIKIKPPAPGKETTEVPGGKEAP
jgi:hypothetical protein